MDAELAKQMFVSARDKHERVGHWCSLALVMGVSFRVLVFTRDAELARAPRHRLNGRARATDPRGSSRRGGW